MSDPFSELEARSAEIDEAVDRFAAAMKLKLKLASFKGSWQDCSPSYLMRAVEEEYSEFVRSWREPGGAMVTEAVDLACTAMMLAGRLFALPTQSDLRTFLLPKWVTYATSKRPALAPFFAKVWQNELAAATTPAPEPREHSLHPGYDKALAVAASRVAVSDRVERTLRCIICRTWVIHRKQNDDWWACTGPCGARRTG